MVGKTTHELDIGLTLLQGVIDSLPDAVAFMDLEGQILRGNQALADLLGYADKSELAGCLLLDFIPAQEGERAKSDLRRLQEFGSFKGQEYGFISKHSARKTVEISASYLKDSAGYPQGFVGIFRDVSESISTQAALPRSKARYNPLYDQNLASFFRLSVDPLTLKVARLEFNDAHARILGYDSREELAERDISQSLFAQEIWGDRLRHLMQARTLFDYEYCLRKKDGSPIWVSANLVYTGGEDGQPGIIEGTMTDITQLKRAQEQVRELQVQLQEQSKLATIGLRAAGIAHNFSSPLQGIINSAEMLQLMHGDLPHLDEILEQANRLTGMLLNMLCKTRQEHDQGLQDIDLNQLLIQELEFLNADLEFKHEIEKEYDFDSSLPTVRGVYGDFSQALTNIMINAIDAMHNHKRKVLAVKTATDLSGDVIIEISDTGCGIPPEHRDRLFDPFFTTKRLSNGGLGDEPTGTGLGLSSAKQLLEKYDAHIAVRSEVGAGTTFAIRIPARHCSRFPGAARSAASGVELMEALI